MRTKSSDINVHLQVLHKLLSDAPRRMTSVETLALQALIGLVEEQHKEYQRTVYARAAASCPCGYEVCRCGQDEKRVGEA